ncbi:MAG: hypothetical protein LVR00_03835 [Rhabdochlamydiaceae bacterium]
MSSSIPKHFYLNWDIQSDRATILKGPDAIAGVLGMNGLNKRRKLVVFLMNCINTVNGKPS